MADNGTTAIRGVYTTELTPTPVTSIDQSNSTQLLSVSYTDLAYYDSNDRGTTVVFINAGITIPNQVIPVTYYKMRGFYTVGGVYESYVVTGSPSFTVPSGHTLTNIVVAAVWVI